MGDIRVGFNLPGSLNNPDDILVGLRAAIVNATRLGRLAIVLVQTSKTCLLESVIAKANASVGNAFRPLVLVTPGNDAHGAPFRKRHASECALRLVGSPQVARWFVSHRKDEPLFAKVRYLPLGFSGRLLSALSKPLGKHFDLACGSCGRSEGGGCEGRIKPGRSMGIRGNPGSTAVCARAASKIAWLPMQAEHALSWDWESGAPVTARRMEMLYVALNTAGIRESFLRRLREPDAMPAYYNHYPTSGQDFFCGALRSVAALSPQGTAFDGFRHAEMLAAGAIAIIPDTPDLREVYAGLPVIFAQFADPYDDAPPLTCRLLMKYVRELEAQARVRPTGTFAYERLTLRFWVDRVQDEARAAAKELHLE